VKTEPARTEKPLCPAKLAAWIVANGLDVRLQLQVHKYVWPRKDRGI